MIKVAFVDLIKELHDRHGIYSLSSAMKQHGVEVYFVGERTYKRALRRVKEIRPDFLLYSSFSSTMSVYTEFDKMSKEFVKARSLIGGPGPTFDWKSIENSSIDSACVGEGEFALVDFIKSNFHTTKNIFRREELAPSGFYPLVELDRLPFPDRDVVYREDSILRNQPSKQFLSGRGCPYQCTYCFNHKFRDIFKGLGPSVRKKSLGYLFDEIRYVKKRYPLSSIVFNDDTFILDRKWFVEFCERFPKEIGLTYTCNIRPNLIDEEVVRLLKDSNCTGVNWSIESGDDYLRNEVLKRNITIEQILNTSELLRKYKISYRIGNIIGLPGENFEQMLKTLKLNIKARPSMAFSGIFVPFPGLALTEYAISHGYYKPDTKRGLPDGRTRCLMNVSQNENLKIQKLFCLFPLFVKYPVLFDRDALRKTLFSIPLCILKILFTFYYGFHMMKLHIPKVSFFQKCQIAMRFIINLYISNKRYRRK